MIVVMMMTMIIAKSKTTLDNRENKYILNKEIELIFNKIVYKKITYYTDMWKHFKFT